MSLPRYPEYKDSGVDWLGEVPKHWGVAPLKRSFKIVGGSTPKSEQESYWDGELVWVTPSDLSKLSSMGINDSQRKITAEGLASCGTTLVPSGTIVLSTRAPIGSLAIAETELCTNQGCKSLVPFAYTQSQFYGYLLSVSTGELNIRGKGTTFLELSGDELGAFKVGVPPIEEQQTIATFLDRETEKIDALIAEQQRLVELLAEKRQAVISHAVTKGLNPNAPMKDSAIEWLGEVPEHWTTCLLKRAFRSVDYGISDSLDSEGEVAILRMGNIQNGQVVTDNLKYTDCVDPYLLLQTGDLLYNRTNSLDLIGKVGMFLGNGDAPVSFASYLVRLRTDEESMPDYFAYLLNTEGILGLARCNAFVAIGQCNLNPTRYGQISIAIPPRVEQCAIAAFLDSETAKFDTLTAEANRAISLLQERRSALISAAVTGKIDVRSRL